MKITDEMVEAVARVLANDLLEIGLTSESPVASADGKTIPLWETYLNLAYTALNAALAAEQTKQGVEVKPLDWRQEPPYHVARIFGNLYAVEGWDGGATLSGIGGRRDFSTVAEAKAAAYSDYKDRVLALVDVPAVESEPELTCPHIDKAIASGELSESVKAELHAIKDINSQLRYGMWVLKAQLSEAHPPRSTLAPAPAGEDVTDEMVNAADSILSRVRPGIPDEVIRHAIAAALSRKGSDAQTVGGGMDTPAPEAHARGADHG